MDSIIVYRNPLEKMFWEGGYKTAFIFAIAFFVVFCASYCGIEKIRLQNARKWQTPNWVPVMAGIIAFIASVVACIYTP